MLLLNRIRDCSECFSLLFQQLRKMARHQTCNEDGTEPQKVTI